MNEPIATTCSRLPLADLCAASLFPEVRIEGDTEAADLGTAAHAVIKDWTPPAGKQRWADIPTAAIRYGVDPAELAQLVSWGWKALLDLLPHFPMAESGLPRMSWDDEEAGVKLSGELDLISLQTSKGEARILDHKSGRLESDATVQLMGYGLLVTKSWPVKRVYLSVLRWRTQRIDGWWVSAEDLHSWWSEFSARLWRDRATFRPGSHCGFCSRGPTCPAKTALLRQAADIVQDHQHEVSTSDLGRVFDAARLLDGWQKNARALVKSEVIAAGGVVPLGDGRQLQITEQRLREIDYPLAAPILRGEIGVDALEEIVSLKVGGVEKAVGEKAGRGGKGREIKRVMDALDKAGAIGFRTVEKLEIKKENDHVSTDDATTGTAARRPAAIAD